MSNDQARPQQLKITDSEVAFAEATPEQLTAVWTLNAAAWAEPLSIEDHIERERILSQQPASGENWRTWVLTPRTNIREIVASVETFVRPVLVSDGNGCRTERGYAIASVFTNPRYRGNRMANVLLHHLTRWLDNEGQAWVSVLFSDIGPDFYTRLGWIPSSVRTLVIATEPDSPQSMQEDELAGLMKTTALHDEDIELLCARDCQHLCSVLDRSIQDGTTRFAFVPRVEMVRWHDKREELNAHYIHGGSEFHFRGVATSNGRAWMIWHFDEVEKNLKVQRLVVLDKQDREATVDGIASMIRFARRQAWSSGMPTMLIWNPSKATIAAAELLQRESDRPIFKLEDRQSSVPSARLRYGASQDGLVWEANEYYAWC